jgi:hypothetical protein
MGMSVSPCQVGVLRGRRVAKLEQEVHGEDGVLGQLLAAQVEFESNTRRQFIIFQFQALSSRRFQRGFDRGNLHRLTRSGAPIAAATELACSTR